MVTHWMTSDLHFNHHNLAVWRGFSSVGEMNEHLIGQWNSVVNPNDQVFVLGDFCWKVNVDSYNMYDIFERLQGRKFLIQGNHDSKHVLNLSWEWVKPYYKHKTSKNGEKTRYIMCHYPFMFWENSDHGYLHLHGHLHLKDNEPTKVKRFDVGVDANHFSPVSLEYIKNWAGHRAPTNHLSPDESIRV